MNRPVYRVSDEGKKLTKISQTLRTAIQRFDLSQSETNNVLANIREIGIIFYLKRVRQGSDRIFCIKGINYHRPCINAFLGCYFIIVPDNYDAILDSTESGYNMLEGR